MTRAASIVGLFSCLFLWTAAEAQQQSGGGRVQLPLDAYLELQRQAQGKTPAAPAAFSIARAEVQVAVGAEPAGPARVSAECVVRTLRDEWVAVPLFRAGTAVESATQDGEPASLVPVGDFLSFAVGAAGTHRVKLPRCGRLGRVGVRAGDRLTPGDARSPGDYFILLRGVRHLEAFLNAG